jgi:hypothetical protein
VQAGPVQLATSRGALLYPAIGAVENHGETDGVRGASAEIAWDAASVAWCTGERSCYA